MFRRNIQYCSDLHLEKRLNLPVIPVLSDILLLAGDIGYPKTEIYQQFLSETSKKYKSVYIIDGNHEWDKGIPEQQRFNNFSNIHHLENSWKFLNNDYVIMGCTLWTPYINKHKITNQQSVIYIHNHLYEFHKRNKKVIMLTHHLPSFSLISKKYKNNPNICRFANELDYMFYQKWAPKIWICGHSHSFIQKKIGNTTCGINTFCEKYTSCFEL